MQNELTITDGKKLATNHSCAKQIIEINNHEGHKWVDNHVGGQNELTITDGQKLVKNHRWPKI